MSATHDTIPSSTDSPDNASQEAVPSNELAVSVRQVALVVLGFILTIGLTIGLVLWGIHQQQMADPYVRSVLALEGDSARGEEIFRLNCATCHGLEASGEVGPNLHDVSARKSRIGLIEQVISGKTPPMPQFQPDPKEMADLLEFLETL